MEVAANILNKQSQTDDKGWTPPAWGLGEELTTPHRKNPDCYEMLYRASELAGFREHGNEPSGSTEGREFFD
jgi:hypothetical protein